MFLCLLLFFIYFFSSSSAFLLSNCMYTFYHLNGLALSLCFVILAIALTYHSLASRGILPINIVYKNHKIEHFVFAFLDFIKMLPCIFICVYISVLHMCSCIHMYVYMCVCYISHNTLLL